MLPPAIRYVTVADGFGEVAVTVVTRSPMSDDSEIRKLRCDDENVGKPVGSDGRKLS